MAPKRKKAKAKARSKKGKVDIHWALMIMSGIWRAYGPRNSWTIERDGPYRILYKNGDKIEARAPTAEIPDPLEYFKGYVNRQENR